MKRTVRCLIFSLLILFGFILNVKAESLPGEKNGVVTLDKNYSISTTTISNSSEVDVLDLNGKTLTLSGTLKLNKDFEIKNGTIIRASSFTSGAMITVNNGASLNVKNVTIDGKKVTVSSVNNIGCGLYIGKNSSATLNGVKVINHYAGNNIGVSGIYASNIKKLIIENSELYGNKLMNSDQSIITASALLVNYANLVEIRNSKIYDNTSASVSNVNLIWVKKMVFDEKSIIKNNSAIAVGGMRLQDTAGVVSGTFEGNKSTGDNGGGLYVLYKTNDDFVVNITSSAKFVNNESTFAGGGLYVNSHKTNIPGRVIIDGTSFTGNKALGTVDATNGLYKDIGGGAIAVARGILEINDIQMSNNIASSNKGNGIIVSHANENINGGKLIVNGGEFSDSIDLGVGSIVVNGGSFKQDVSKYITDEKTELVVTENGYKVIKNAGNVSIVGVVANTSDDEVVLNSLNAIDLGFNALNQKATYKVKITNPTMEDIYIKDLLVEGITEDFIEVVLSDSSINKKIGAGKVAEVEVVVKTLDISNAGRNVNDDFTLKFLLERKVKNPETIRNLLSYIILAIVLFGSLSIILRKLNHKRTTSFMLLCLLCGVTLVVSANDDEYIVLNGKVKYVSENMMQASGIKLNNYQLDKTNAVDIWKYTDSVKNIVIATDGETLANFTYKFDLTSSSSKKILGYLVENDDDNAPYDLYIIASGVIYAPSDASGLFAFSKVESISGMENVVFNNTVNMSGMFYGDKKLKSVNLNSINTGNVTDAPYMFYDCDKLNLSNVKFDLSNIVNKDYMFDVKVNEVVKIGAKSDGDTDFNAASVTGTYMIENTKNDENPIYYYRGDVTNNNVIFANLCWKIVRTTETGGTKLIYNGKPSAGGYCENSGAASHIRYSQYSSNSKSVANFNYLTSTARSYVDLWYQTNLLSYTDMLENTVWCNDRQVHDKTTITSFGAYSRLFDVTTPSLSCASEDSLTVSENELTYPVGLLTADEVALAGIYRRNNSRNNYLDNKISWWTMSAAKIDSYYSYMYRTADDGYRLQFASVDYSDKGLRPSISLNSNAEFAYGTGTTTNPYVVK